MKYLAEYLLGKENIFLKKRYFISLFFPIFTLLVLGLLVSNIKNRNLIKSEASIEVNNTLANEERTFTKAIVDAYSTDYDDFSSSLLNGYSYARDINQYSKRPNDLNGLYRTLCMMVTSHMVAYGKSATSEDTIIKYFINNYSKSEMRTLIDNHVYHFTAAVPVYDCLFSVSLAKNILPEELTGSVLDDAKYAAQLFYPVYTPDYYKTRWTNKGDTPAEEFGFSGMLFLLAAELLPDSGPGAITFLERQQYLNRAKELFSNLTSQCTSGCSYQPGKYLVINHQMDPNPNYTLSALTYISEIAAVYNQLGKPLPSDIFSPNFIAFMTSVGNSLREHLDGNFGFKGEFSEIDTSGNILTTHLYELTRYSFLDNDYLSPIYSSVPIENIDAFTEYIPMGSNKIKISLYKDNSMWQFSCLLGGQCEADSLTSPLDRIWSTISNQTEAGWGRLNLPTSIDAASAWLLPGTNDSKNYFYKDNYVWHYICNSGNCTASYVMNLSDHWNSINPKPPDYIGDPPFTGYPMPVDKIDAISQFLLPDSRTLKSYVFRGNRVWHYICENVGISGAFCYQSYTKDLNSLWSQVGGDWVSSGWGSYPPPGDSIDAMSQYYIPDGSILKSYIYKGDRRWRYDCTPNGCVPVYTQTLKEALSGIRYQYKWPFFTTNQLKGVADWGMDGTFQNSGFSGLYLLNPSFLNLYQSLQLEQGTRGRKTNPPFPRSYDYDQNKWSNSAKFSTVNGQLLAALRDGSYIIPTSIKVNSHWWLNFLAAKNHSMAFLSLTSEKLMESFSNSPTPLPTVITSTLTAAPTVGVIPGDSDNDGNVDEEDYAKWLLYYDPVKIQEGGASIGDFNGDTKVDGIDYTIWLNNYSS